MKDLFGQAWDHLFDPPIAHRGLWDEHVPENSLSAFQAACQAGYGIELDVQLSADGEAMVFHDATLERMTGEAGRIADHHTADLSKMKLDGSEDTIPTLTEALAVIGHRAMVFIELKTPYGEVGPLEKRVSEILIDHNGPTAVIGFNPYSHAWFAGHHPQILRGLDSYGYRDNEVLAREQRKAYAALEHVGLAKPHFLVLGMDIVAEKPAAKFRDNGMPIVAWTVRSGDDRARAREHADNIIFEGFVP
ncbi:MAG TPA: glycerophosphodiester phosphodiesterase family protein [Caulobacteraceae bacterium]|nr:glycerophosphodiester phosphodiesterase family protein [Caulobacteraceae bacterium]